MKNELNLEAMEKLKPCPNPECQHPTPITFDEDMEAYVYCPKCFLRGPEFSLCTNRRLYAEVAWDNLSRRGIEEEQKCIIDAQAKLIEALEENLRFQLARRGVGPSVDVQKARAELDALTGVSNA